MIRRSQFAVVTGIALAVLSGAACSDKSSSPTTPTTTITTPTPVSPSQGAQLSDLTQPLTLTVQNATTTGTNPLTYTFEVALDSAFANRVYSKTGVAAGTSGQTSLQIDRLGAGQSYFWRARAEDLAVVVVSSWSSAGFSIGPGVRFDAPVANEPLNGDRAGSVRPLLRVRLKSLLPKRQPLNRIAGQRGLAAGGQQDHAAVRADAQGLSDIRLLPRGVGALQE